MVRQGCKKQWRKGTEHLVEKSLCQVCFDLENDGRNHDQSDKIIQLRLANSQVANDTDQTAFDTFVQQESADLSCAMPE